MEQLTRLSDWTGLSVGVLAVISGIFLALVVGSIARLTHLHRLPTATAHSLLRRLRTWWIIALILGLVVLLGRPATVALMCLVSLLAMREYAKLVAGPAGYGPLMRWVYAATVLQYVWVSLQFMQLFTIFIPVLMLLALTLRAVLLRRPDGFIHLVGSLQWGLMMFVYSVSHVAYLLSLPPEQNPAGGAIGWFLYLIVLTEFNDIAKALWGRPLGRHKIIPEISPGKSWEGLLGAVVCTTLLSVLLAPVLTPLADPSPRLGGGLALGAFPVSVWSVLAGVVISLAGFCGDVAVSAVKRDVHVKDSGSLLPGQGGILDRIDSLTFTAPLFFHGVYVLYY